MHVPGGNLGYHAFWIRDFVMMLGSGLVSIPDLEDEIRLMASAIRGRDWRVRPGVVVPAYAVPDHINFNGKPTFYPGDYETGTAQGGRGFGKYPPLDDQFYFVKAVYEYWKLTGSTALFDSSISTSFGRIKLSALCERVYRVDPVDATTGLCVAGNVTTENAKDFGFCDGVFKSGKLLFPSVLKYVAANELAELFKAAGQSDRSEAFLMDARKIKANIATTFFHSTKDGNEAWLYSATGVGNQPDVWGSAFAVFSGAVDRTIAAKVARTLVRAYHDKTAVREGCVREIIDRRGWQKSMEPVGEYQNGGYWGTAAGWYIAAMNSVDSTAAANMASDYIQFLRSHMRPDGLAEAWEWFNPDTGKHDNPLYVATVALPYVSMREAGLLHATPRP